MVKLVEYVYSSVFSSVRSGGVRGILVDMLLLVLVVVVVVVSWWWWGWGWWL